jgi:hypothetical protein
MEIPIFLSFSFMQKSDKPCSGAVKNYFISIIYCFISVIYCNRAVNYCIGARKYCFGARKYCFGARHHY